MAFVLLNLQACGYTLMGTKADSTYSVLGKGDKTIAITKIEQSSLLPWVSYELRNRLHSEMQLRQFAKITSADTADYSLEANLTSFEISSYISNSSDETLLSSVIGTLSIFVYDKNQDLVWSSGSVSYSETFERVEENQAIRDTIKELVYTAYDKMQNTF